MMADKAATYDDNSGGLRHEGDNGLQQQQMMAAAYDGDGSGLHCQQMMAVAYANDSSVDND